MKENKLNTHGNKEYIFSKYFVINNGKIFSTTNFCFEDNLKNCFYIKRIISNTKPEIYLDIKINNKWIKENQYIGDYNKLMEFVEKTQNSYICIRGFNSAGIEQFLKMMEENKGITIKPVKFKSKLAEAQYERYLVSKQQAIEELQDKMENAGKIENAEQHMKIANFAFGKGRHLSRQKVIKIKKK